MSLVNSRFNPLHAGHTPPTVHPFGITRAEHGLEFAERISETPFATCWWLIDIFGFGQKQHLSPGMHLQACWRFVCGQSWVHPSTACLIKTRHIKTANSWETKRIVDTIKGIFQPQHSIKVEKFTISTDIYRQDWCFVVTILNSFNITRTLDNIERNFKRLHRILYSICVSLTNQSKRCRGWLIV